MFIQCDRCSVNEELTVSMRLFGKIWNICTTCFLNELVCERCNGPIYTFYNTVNMKGCTTCELKVYFIQVGNVYTITNTINGYLEWKGCVTETK